MIEPTWWRRARALPFLFLVCGGWLIGCDDTKPDAGPTDSAAGADASHSFSRMTCVTAADCSATASVCTYAACVGGGGGGGVTMALPDGAVCNHTETAGACQVGGVCNAAVCQNAQPRDCDDDDPCTVCTTPAIPRRAAASCCPPMRASRVTTARSAPSATSAPTAAAILARVCAAPPTPTA